MIEYNRERNYIFIDWDRIRAFAMLSEPLRLPQGKVYHFTRTKRFKARRCTVGQQMQQYHATIQRELDQMISQIDDNAEQWFYRRAEDMTETELLQLMACLPCEPFPKTSIT